MDYALAQVIKLDHSCCSEPFLKGSGQNPLLSSSRQMDDFFTNCELHIFIKKERGERKILGVFLAFRVYESLFETR